MTAQELLEYRHEPYQQELIAGILHEMEPPGAQHGAVLIRAGRILDAHVEAGDLGLVLGGDVGFRLASDPDTVRGPDVAFVSRERVEATGIPKGYWPGPPDLAIEITSPNDRRPAVERKALDWLAAGTRVVVVLDPPTRTATVHRPGAHVRSHTGDEPLDLGDVLPGFAPPVDSLLP